MALRPDEQVNLKGRQHPLYRGVLREAHENGLLELSVKMLQAPDETNGHTAIAEATAVFAGEGGRERIFTEIGDANPKNCGPMIALHCIRMAATRAKGRALRDALGLGEALMEEMGGAEETTAGSGPDAASVRQQGGQGRGAAAASRQPVSRSGERAVPVGGQPGNGSETIGPVVERPSAATGEFCAGCGQELMPRELEGCRRHPTWFDNNQYCTDCAREYRLVAERAKLPSEAVAS